MRTCALLPDSLLSELSGLLMPVSIVKELSPMSSTPTLAAPGPGVWISPASSFLPQASREQKTRRQAPGCVAPTYRGTARCLTLTLACIRPAYESNRFTPTGAPVPGGNSYTTPPPRFWQAPSPGFPQKSSPGRWGRHSCLPTCCPRPQTIPGSARFRSGLHIRRRVSRTPEPSAA